MLISLNNLNTATARPRPIAYGISISTFRADVPPGSRESIVTPRHADRDKSVTADTPGV